MLPHIFTNLLIKPNMYTFFSLYNLSYPAQVVYILANNILKLGSSYNIVTANFSAAT